MVCWIFGGDETNRYSAEETQRELLVYKPSRKGPRQSSHVPKPMGLRGVVGRRKRGLNETILALLLGTKIYRISAFYV